MKEKDIKFDLDNFKKRKFEALTNKQGVQPGILTQEQQDIKNQLFKEDWNKYYHREYKKKYRKTDLKGFLNSRIKEHKRYDKYRFGIEGDIDLEFILNLIEEVKVWNLLHMKIAGFKCDSVFIYDHFLYFEGTVFGEAFLSRRNRSNFTSCFFSVAKRMILSPG